MIAEDSVKPHPVCIQLFAMAPDSCWGAASRECCCVISGNTFPFARADPNLLKLSRRAAQVQSTGSDRTWEVFLLVH